VDEPYSFYNEQTVYELDYAPPTSDLVYGYATGRLPNRSEYYSTYHDLYLTASATRQGVAVSGSWIGSKTGSLRTIEGFTGSFSGSVTGSLSGSGYGRFNRNSQIIGVMSGSGTGSFDGTATGIISGTLASASGYLHAVWNGTLTDPNLNYLTQSWFTGSFSGSVSGTFWGDTHGHMTASQFGVFYGHRFGPWSGQLTGTVNGSVRSVNMSGSFNGNSSASQYIITSPGEQNGTITRLWYGNLSGSFTGSFTGSGVWQWSGSTPWLHYSYVDLGGYAPWGLALFTGSFKGVISSSIYNLTNLLEAYASGTFSGSFIQQWTGSPVTLYNKPIMPTDILWENYDNYFPLNATASQVTNYCSGSLIWTIWTPVYPYEFLLQDVEKTSTTPSYGPNRFKNEKVKPKLQSVATRLSDTERSTRDLVSGIPSDSNLLGLYLDPQDAKNRDIVKFCGNTDVIGLIADPSNLYSASYTNLRTLNRQYNNFGDRRVLYNELITLYKLYFNRSLFDTVKNVVPARTSLRTGILIEPTILERPKYQNRPIVTEINTSYFDVTASHYFRDGNTKLIRFSGSRGNTSSGKLGLLYSEFNWDTSYSQSSFQTSSLPANLMFPLHFNYLTEANFNYPVNYNNGYITDLTDELQFGKFGGFGDSRSPRGKMVEDGTSSFVLAKQWTKYTIYSKSGSYTRTSNKYADVYTSHSVWLYKLVSMTEAGHANFFYPHDTYVLSSSLRDITSHEDVVQIGGYYYYLHRANTAIATPNFPFTAIRASDNHIGFAFTTAVTPYVLLANDTYFEIFGGYPRNHYTHKRMQFSPVRFKSLIGKFRYQTEKIYVRGSQTVETTIDNKSGLEDASLPVQTIRTSNVNLVKSDNVINQ
jgi:hypothetical protein